MADTPEDDELLLDTPAEDQSEAEHEGEQGSKQPGDEGEDELEVTIGDEAAPASGERDTNLVKHLREEIRKRDKLLAGGVQAPPQPVDVGPKPTIEGCDFLQEKFEEEYDAWIARKAEAEQAESAVQKEQREANEAWLKDVQRFEAQRNELKVPGASEAIETATASLSQVQVAALVSGLDNPALVLTALGKHPAKLAELSQITNPLKLTAAAAKLEGMLKVTPRKRAPAPEELPRGNASTATVAKDSATERLVKRAQESGGDVSDLLRRNREQRRAAQAK